jgi:hypothetical protein
MAPIKRHEKEKKWKWKTFQDLNFETSKEAAKE